MDTGKIVLNPDIVIEDFDHGSLLLNLKTRAIRELLAAERRILSLIEKNLPAAAGEENVFLIKKAEFLENSILLNTGDLMNKKYQRNPSVNLREEDENGALLYDPDSDRIQLLNHTGLAIWKLCAEKKSTAEITKAIVREYDNVPEGQVNEDLKNFLAEMVAIGFIQESEK